MNTRKLIESKLFSEKFGDTKDTFSIDKNKLQLDFEHAKPVSVNQGYFGVDSNGNIIGDKKDGYGNGGLIKQYKSPSAALYASGSGYWTTRELEEGDVVGYIGIVKEVAMVPVILKKKVID